MYISPFEEKLCSNAGLKNQAQVDFQAIRMALFGLVFDIFFFRSNTTFMQRGHCLMSGRVSRDQFKVQKEIPVHSKIKFLYLD